MVFNGGTTPVTTAAATGAATAATVAAEAAAAIPAEGPRTWTQVVDATTPTAVPGIRDEEMVPLPPPSEGTQHNQKKKKKNKKKKKQNQQEQQQQQHQQQHQHQHQSSSLAPIPVTGPATAAAAGTDISTPMETDTPPHLPVEELGAPEPQPAPLHVLPTAAAAAAAATPATTPPPSASTGGDIPLHSNRFASLSASPATADQPSAWRGAVRQYLDLSVGLEDQQLQQELLQQFSLAFAPDLDTLDDTAISLPQRMIDWLQAHLPAALRGSYGGDSDTSA